MSGDPRTRLADDRFEDLVARHLDGELTDDDIATLVGEALADPARAARLRGERAIHGDLRAILAPSAGDAAFCAGVLRALDAPRDDDRAFTDRVLRRVDRGHRTSLRTRALTLVIGAAAAVVLAAVTVRWFRDDVPAHVRRAPAVAVPAVGGPSVRDRAPSGSVATAPVEAPPTDDAAAAVEPSEVASATPADGAGRDALGAPADVRRAARPVEIAVVVPAIVDVPPAPAVRPRGPAPAPPLGQGWEPLFALDSLDGWKQVWGTWRISDGIVGGGTPSARSRLEGERTWTGFDLVCEVRLEGMRVGELQVGDYAYFALIDLNGREQRWYELRASLYGGVLTASLDGMPLTIERGNGWGSGGRGGPIAFFASRGGVISIRNACIRARDEGHGR